MVIDKVILNILVSKIICALQVVNLHEALVHMCILISHRKSITYIYII